MINPLAIDLLIYPSTSHHLNKDTIKLKYFCEVATPSTFRLSESISSIVNLI